MIVTIIGVSQIAATAAHGASSLDPQAPIVSPEREPEPSVHGTEEEHLGPTVAELKDPQQMQLAPQTQGGPAWWLEPVQELPETPVLERRMVSPASAPAEPEDVPAVASAPMAGPELEPQEPTAEPSSPRIGWARRLAWEPEHVPCAIDASQLSSTLLTLMCAELYSRVEYEECKVAKKCLALRNFESFRAINFALQHPPVRRLESTWGHVSWKSSWIYKKLRKRNNRLKRKQLIKEARAMVRKWQQSPRALQHMNKQGMVPPLALILYDALQKQQEHHVDATDFIVELLTYKFLARQYDLEPKEHFLSFFRRVKILREDQW
ncbi:Ral-GDS-related protein [Manis javanica]|nr:Ral-GDS-related protein [Manis javanica]